jgi:hypothetical protein
MPPPSVEPATPPTDSSHSKDEQAMTMEHIRQTAQEFPFLYYQRIFIKGYPNKHLI